MPLVVVRALLLALWFALMGVPQDVIVLMGDSTVDTGGSIPAHPSTLIGYDYNRSNAGTWTDLSGGSQTSWTPDLVQQWNSNKSRTLGAINLGFSGTDLVRTGHWDPAISLVYIDSTIWGNGNFFTGAGNPVIAKVAMQIGANDVQPAAAWTAAQYTAAIGRLQARITATYNGAPSLYVGLFADKGITTQWPNNQDPDYILQINKIRQGIIDAWDQGLCLPGANLTGLVYSDHTHPDDLPDAATIGRAWYLALNSGTPCPRKAQLTLSSSRTVVTVRLDRALSNSLSSAVGGFRVKDNGSSVTISSALVSDAQTIALTLAAPIAGVCTVSFASGEDAIGATLPVGASQVLADTSTYQAPLVPFFDVVAGTASQRVIARAG